MLKCQNIEYHKKELFITNLQKILILALQRINFREQTKIKCLVNFIEKLDLSKYIDNDSKNNQKSEYNLLGFIYPIWTLNLHKFFVKITLFIISFIKGFSLELENSLKSFSHWILSFKFLYLISAYLSIKFLKIS